MKHIMIIMKRYKLLKVGLLLSANEDFLTFWPKSAGLVCGEVATERQEMEQKKMYLVKASINDNTWKHQ